MTLVNGEADQSVRPESTPEPSPAAPTAAAAAGGAAELGEENNDRIVPCLSPGYSSLALLGLSLLASSPQSSIY